MTGDTITVNLGITGLGRTSFVFEYELTDQNGRLLATAKTVQVMFDYATKKPVPLLDEFRRVVGEYEGIARSL